MPAPEPPTPGPLTPHEVRADPRVGVDLPVEVHSADLPAPLLGRSRDLSVGGVCVATPSPFACKSVRRVVLRLPDRSLALEAEGRWQREVAGDDIVLTGLSFVDPDDSVVEYLWDVVLDRGKELARFLYARTDVSNLGLEEAMGIAQATRVQHVPAGRWLYTQGRPGPEADSIYVVLEGRVVLQVRVRDAVEKVFDTVGPGGLFGGAGVVGGEPPSESAVAETNLRLLEIDARSYQYLLAAKPWLALRLAQLVNRVRARRTGRLLGFVRDLL